MGDRLCFFFLSCPLFLHLLGIRQKRESEDVRAFSLPLFSFRDRQRRGRRGKGHGFIFLLLSGPFRCRHYSHRRAGRALAFSFGLTAKRRSKRHRTSCFPSFYLPSHQRSGEREKGSDFFPPYSVVAVQEEKWERGTVRPDRLLFPRQRVLNPGADDILFSSQEGFSEELLSPRRRAVSANLSFLPPFFWSPPLPCDYFSS